LHETTPHKTYEPLCVKISSNVFAVGDGKNKKSKGQANNHSV